ncbi:MAG: hypothetical protein GC182_08980 [Rhodopseudomonas sp.]|nr:hypothetical protein [Rhodopseudomonas sp.]
MPGQIAGRKGRKERWIIGFMVEKSQRALISLSDGLIAHVGTAEEIADVLNAAGDQPAELIDRARAA